MVVQVKAVATGKRASLEISQQAFELLNDHGEQDLGGLVGGDDWHILKAQCSNRMSMPYTVGTTKIYEEIFQVRIVLQEKS